jgi:rRNA processing protein Krr1/Pno1
MSTTSVTTDNPQVQVALGVAVVVIILIAFFSKGGSNEEVSSKKKKGASAAASGSSASTSTSSAAAKKSKKKKSTSSSSTTTPKPTTAKVAQSVEKKVVFQEPAAPTVVVVEEEEETKVAASKKKKKPKKKGNGSSSAAAASSTASGESKNVTFASSEKPANDSDDEEEEDDDDDDIELWRIQSSSKNKGVGLAGSDFAKRAAANKERDRLRALKRQEEKKAKAAAEAAKAQADAAAAVIAEEEKARKVKEEEAAAVEVEKKQAAVAAKSKKNGATTTVNGGSTVASSTTTASASPAADGSTTEATSDAEKKKRKRKKKKDNGSGGASSSTVPASRPTLVKPAPTTTAATTTSAVEHWEVVPKVEEWQEVGSKKAKLKGKLDSPNTVTAPSGGHGGGDVSNNTTAAASSAFFSDEPVVEEAGETSATLSAGEDPLIFIGKGGATIQNLQTSTGAKFHLNRTTNILTISGSDEAVQLGLVAAQSILDAVAERKANETTESVTWGSDAIKAVIGRGGANIRAVEEVTGVRIDADVDAGTLVIVGPSHQVSAALTMCHNAAFGEVQDILELGSRNAVNLVYGPNFASIRSLQDSTGCKLDIARGSTVLKLAGSSEAVAEATSRIRALLESNRGFEMIIENSKVGAVYGKSGETLRSIQERTGTLVDVSRGPTHATVSVMGTVEASARARNMLQRAIDGEVELQPGEVAEEIELGSATAAVIGRGGSNIAELEKRHGVKINVRSEFQKARVVGKPEKVQSAVKDITAIAKPILDAEKAQKKAEDALQTGESAWQVVGGADDADGW